jgi:hypothetical protein
MSVDTLSGDSPVVLHRTRHALHGLAQLLQCVDAQRWNSLARPSAAGLSALLFVTVDGMDAGLAEARLPPVS